MKKNIPLRIMVLKKLTNKKYKCVDCNKSFYKYQMYICLTCHKPMFCQKCLKEVASYECITVVL